MKKIEIEEELNNLEKAILSTESYKEAKLYPREINRTIVIGNSLYDRLRYRELNDRSKLLKVVSLLDKYLIKGGRLKRQDVRNYAFWIVESMEVDPLILLKIDLSKTLSSLGYTDDEISELNVLLNKYIISRIKKETGEEPKKDLLDYLRNEFLLLTLLDRA